MIGYSPPDISKKDREVLLHSLTKVAGNKLTICEQLRFIYDDVYNLEDSKLKQDIVEKLVIAFNMGKKMNAKLAHYKRLHSDGRGGNNLVRLSQTKKRESMRAERC